MNLCVQYSMYIVSKKKNVFKAFLYICDLFDCDRCLAKSLKQGIFARTRSSSKPT